KQWFEALDQEDGDRLRAALAYLLVDIGDSDPLAPRVVELNFIWQADAESELISERLDEWWTAMLAGQALSFTVLPYRHLKTNQVLLVESRQWYEVGLDEITSD